MQIIDKTYQTNQKSSIQHLAICLAEGTVTYSAAILTQFDNLKAVHARSNLLKAIRGSISLRKVDLEQVGRDNSFPTAKAAHAVSSILARRVAIEVSDSDSDADPNNTGWTGT